MRRASVLIAFVSLSLFAQLEIPEIVVYGERKVKLEPLSLPGYEFVDELPVPGAPLSVKRMLAEKRVTPVYLPPDCEVEAGGYAGNVYGGFFNAYFQHMYFPSCVIIKGGRGGINKEEGTELSGFADIEIDKIYTSVSVFRKEFVRTLGYVKWNGFYSHQFFDAGIEAQSMFSPENKVFLRGFFEGRYEGFRGEVFWEHFLKGGGTGGGEVSFGKGEVELGIGWKEGWYPLFSFFYPWRGFSFYLRLGGDAYLLSPERLLSFNPFSSICDSVYHYRIIEGGIDWWRCGISFYGKRGTFPAFSDTAGARTGTDAGVYLSYRDSTVSLKGGYSWNDIDYPVVFFTFGFNKWIASVDFRMLDGGRYWADIALTLNWRDFDFGIVMRNILGVNEFYPSHSLRFPCFYAFLIWKKAW